MKNKRLVLLMLFCMIVAGFATAGGRAPLPKRLIDAKSVYIDNRTGDAELGDKAYDELKKWGRFKIVDDVKAADLVFLLTTQEWSAGSLVVGQVNSYGGVTMNEIPRSSGTTYLTVFDAPTGQKIWANSRDWGKFKSATRAIIKDLKDRIDEQSKSRDDK